MLRKLRITLGIIFLLGITVLFLDFTGSVHRYLGWIAKVQFLPALLALNVAVVIALVALTLLLGRLYCSVICPLGVFQDVVTRLGTYSKKRKFRFAYSKAHNFLRTGTLTLFILCLITGVGSIVAILDPYGTYGMFVNNLFSPVYIWINNIFAHFAERADSYAFYEKEIWIRSWIVFGVTSALFVTIAVIAWRNGRLYCNTICPVGSLLGLISRYSIFAPVIDKSKCNSCGLCSRRCKSSCIDGANHTIDYSRCVVCMDCISTCAHGAIKFGRRKDLSVDKTAGTSTDSGRRSFLTIASLFATAAAVKAADHKVDGGLAVVLDKKVPARRTPVVPAGALSLRNLSQHCTGCQLCVSACPQEVLRPDDGLKTLLQPRMSFERGFCRPECTRCADLCPAGAIKPIDKADKASTQIGHAVWIKENCVPIADGVECGNCARHCPAGAISMVPSDPGNPDSPKIPAVNIERCIGCGACEFHCPSRPFSAIYVEGNEVHRLI